MKLQFHISGQKLKVNKLDVVAGTVNYLDASFLFQNGKDWEGLEKWCHFKNGESVFDIMLTDDAITADMGMNLSAGDWHIFVHGDKVKGDKVERRITTDEVVVSVKPSRGSEDIYPTAPPIHVPSAGEQIIAQAQTARNEAVEASEKAKDDADRSEAAMTVAGEFASSAQGFKNQAESALNELKDGIASGEFKGEPGYTPVKGVDYFDGSPGKPGKDGNDYVLTDADKEQIAGMAKPEDYEQYKQKTDDNEEVSNELKEIVTELNGRKIDKPTDAPVVGKILRVKSVNADGTFVCEWADAGVGNVNDVQVDGTSILDENKNANFESSNVETVDVPKIKINGVEITDNNIPIAKAENGSNTLGLVTADNWNAGGIGISATSGKAYIKKATDADINAKTNDYKPIVPSNLEYAVKSVGDDAYVQKLTDFELCISTKITEDINEAVFSIPDSVAVKVNVSIPNTNTINKSMDAKLNGNYRFIFVSDGITANTKRYFSGIAFPVINKLFTLHTNGYGAQSSGWWTQYAGSADSILRYDAIIIKSIYFLFLPKDTEVQIYISRA